MGQKILYRLFYTTPFEDKPIPKVNYSKIESGQSGEFYGFDGEIFAETV